jgi:hypothetical protein
MTDYEKMQEVDLSPTEMFLWYMEYKARCYQLGVGHCSFDFYVKYRKAQALLI